MSYTVTMNKTVHMFTFEKNMNVLFLPTVLTVKLKCLTYS